MYRWNPFTNNLEEKGDWFFGGNTLGSKKTIGSIDNQDFGIITNNTERLTVLKGGNVGIGTSTPSEKLEVVGKLKIGNNTISGESFTFEEDTFFGMKVANPNGYIRITPGNSSWAHIYTDRGNFIFNKPVWTIAGAFSSYYNQNLLLQTGGTTRISVGYANGNVGIGITTPTAKLDVNSDILRLRTAKTPATAGATGNQGDIAWDSGYLYVCVNTNEWKRAELLTW